MVTTEADSPAKETEFVIDHKVAEQVTPDAMLRGDMLAGTVGTMPPTKRQLMDKLREYKTQVEVIQKRPNTCVRIRLTDAWGRKIKIVGFSKVQWPDNWDAEYGKELAITKAYADLAKRIMRGKEQFVFLG